MIQGETLATGAPGYMNDFYVREFWRFVEVQEQVATSLFELGAFPLFELRPHKTIEDNGQEPKRPVSKAWK